MSATRVLIVEDNPMTLKMLTTLMLRHGYEVAGATNTGDALQIIQDQEPDLMILDLTLVAENPFSGIGDGFSFKKWMEYKFPYWDFPIVINTSNTADNLREVAIDHGIPWVVRKGDKPAVLLETVRKALDHHRSRCSS